jgi:type II secretory pathway pseudopilin PulG
MTRTRTIRHTREGEQGYILLAVIFMLAILVISMAVAIPRVREDIQRDREVETMHRGKQYIRAIQLYYKKFHAYPPNLEALVKTNEIRFLRKRYIDPITGKDDWKPIQFGQTKAPVAMGFFGQPLAGGSTLAGTGPGGIPGAVPVAGSTGASGFSNGMQGGSSFGSSNANSFSGTSGFGGNSSGPGLTQTPAAGTGTGFSSQSSDTSGNTGPSTGMSTNQTFGGGGIVGFSPDSAKQSILVYKTKTHYNEWEFVYSPLLDQMMQGGGNLGTIGQPAGGNSTGFGTNGSGTGGFNLNPGGSSPTQPVAPSNPTSPTTGTSPQQ